MKNFRTDQPPFSLLEQFQQHVADNNLLPGNGRLLLTVSGGVDSVVLFELIRLSGYEFGVAHVNFGLRGEESDHDEQFVRELCAKYQIRFYTIVFDTEEQARLNRQSIQETARQLRYEWFSALAEEHGYDAILTAHHADDNIETMMMNFFRGTGIAGLRGIKASHNNITRPLLPFTKEQLVSFAREQQLVWREDRSNQTTDYTRNDFRLQILPMVKNWYPRADENLRRNAERFSEVELLYRQAIDHHKKKLVQYHQGELHIPVLKLAASEPLQTIFYELLHPYGFSADQTKEAIKLLKAEHGSHLRSPTHMIFRNRKWLIVAPLGSEETDHILVDEYPASESFREGRLELSATTKPLDTGDSNTVFLDMKEMVFPLIVRKWKQGDYFYPLGMTRKKKISRFLIDQKISRSEKDKVWVVETAEKKICWVIGYRPDNRFRIKDNQSEKLKIVFSRFQDKTAHRE